MSMVNMTEKELIRRCKKKNAKAQKLLYKRYHGSLLGICMRYGKSKAEAEDILQMAMLKIYKKIDSFSERGSFEGWMKRIVVNVAVDNFRKNSKYYYHDSIDNANEKFLGSGDIPDNLEANDILRTIQQLAPGYRMVFNLYAIEGYSHKEIAEKLGITESTSKTQLLKARQKLQKMLLNLNRLPEEQSKDENRQVVVKKFYSSELVPAEVVTQK